MTSLILGECVVFSSEDVDVAWFYEVWCSPVQLCILARQQCLLIAAGRKLLLLLVQASLSSLRAEWQAELAALKSDVEHKRRQAAAALKAKQEEEDLKVSPHRQDKLGVAGEPQRFGISTQSPPPLLQVVVFSDAMADYQVPCNVSAHAQDSWVCTTVVLQHSCSGCASLRARELFLFCCYMQALEFQAQQRLWALQQDQLAAAGTSALQDAAAAQAAALAAEQQRRAAEWQAQDEARALKQQHEAARQARLVAAAEQEAARQAAKGLLLAQELQAQQDMLKVCGSQVPGWQQLLDQA